MMVNFMCELGWATRCPDIFSDFMRMFCNKLKT